MKFVISLPKVVLCVLLGGLTLSVFIEVIQRNIPGIPLLGITEIVRLWSAYLYLLAFAYVTYHRRHITADILSVVVKSDSVFLRYADLVSPLIGAVVCLAYSYLAVVYCCGVAIGRQITPDLGYPRIFLVTSVAIGLILSFIFFMLEFVNKIRTGNYRKVR